MCLSCSDIPSMRLMDVLNVRDGQTLRADFHEVSPCHPAAGVLGGRQYISALDNVIILFEALNGGNES